MYQKVYYKVEISTIYMDFWFPQASHKLPRGLHLLKELPKILGTNGSEFMGFPKLLPGVASIRVWILHICYCSFIKKKPKLEDNITGQNWNGSNKVIKHQKTTSQFVF